MMLENEKLTREPTSFSRTSQLMTPRPQKTDSASRSSGGPAT